MNSKRLQEVSEGTDKCKQRVIQGEKDQVLAEEREDFYAKLLEYITDLDDLFSILSSLSCLPVDEKVPLIEDAEEKLREMEKSYYKKRVREAVFTANDELECVGERPLEKYKGKYEKYKEGKTDQQLLDDRFRRATALQTRCNTIDCGNGVVERRRKLEGTATELASDDEELDEERANLAKDRTALYCAAKGIMKDCKEEYRSPETILGHLQDWCQKYGQDLKDTKILHTAIDLVLPFIRLDCLGFDPLGCTDPKFPYYRKESFQELELWQAIEQCRRLWTVLGSTSVVLAEEGGIVGKVLGDRLKWIIRYLWDPVSIHQTEAVAKAMNEYNKYVYGAAEKQGLDQVKQVIEEVFRALRTRLSLIRVPDRKCTYAERAMWQLLKVRYHDDNADRCSCAASSWGRWCRSGDC